jgi:hypothetical protein
VSHESILRIRTPTHEDRRANDTSSTRPPQTHAGTTERSGGIFPADEVLRDKTAADHWLGLVEDKIRKRVNDMTEDAVNKLPPDAGIAGIAALKAASSDLESTSIAAHGPGTVRGGSSERTSSVPPTSSSVRGRASGHWTVSHTVVVIVLSFVAVSVVLGVVRTRCSPTRGQGSRKG